MCRCVDARIVNRKSFNTENFSSYLVEDMVGKKQLITKGQKNEGNTRFARRFSFVTCAVPSTQRLSQNVRVKK